MSSTKFYELFNNKLNDFLLDLIKTFPEDKDFKIVRNSIKIILLSDKQKGTPQRLFNMGLNDTYRNNIATRNEEFFMEADYTDIIQNQEILSGNNGDTEDIINDKIIKKLKGYWKGLKEENRDIVWKYFDILIKINDKCITV
jgi:hypothetical protein